MDQTNSHCRSSCNSLCFRKYLYQLAIVIPNFVPIGNVLDPTQYRSHACVKSWKPRVSASLAQADNPNLQRSIPNILPNHSSQPPFLIFPSPGFVGHSSEPRQVLLSRLDKHPHLSYIRQIPIKKGKHVCTWFKTAEMSWVYLQDPPQLLLALHVGDQVDLEMRQKSLSPTSASRRLLFSSVILSTDRLSLL